MGLIIHSRSQGLLGVFGLSGVEDFGERGRKRNRRGETEMGRDRLHGRRADGRRICEKIRKGGKKKRTKHKGFSLGCDRIPKVRAVKNEEADDGGLEVRTSADSSKRRP